jgi:hypothetical protein
MIKFVRPPDGTSALGDRSDELLLPEFTFHRTRANQPSVFSEYLILHPTLMMLKVTGMLRYLSLTEGMGYSPDFAAKLTEFAFVNTAPGHVLHP